VKLIIQHTPEGFMRNFVFCQPVVGCDEMVFGFALSGWGLFQLPET